MMLIKLIKSAMLIGVKMVYVLRYIWSSKPSKTVIDLMGKHLHKKITGTKTLPKAPNQDNNWVKKYLKGILFIERTGADDVTRDIDIEYNQQISDEYKKNQMLQMVVMAMNSAYYGNFFYVLLIASLGVLGFFTDNSYEVRMICDIATTKSYRVKLLKMVLHFFIFRYQNNERPEIVGAEVLVETGSILMSESNLTYLDVKGITEIEKEEMDAVYDEHERIEKKKEMYVITSKVVKASVLIAIIDKIIKQELTKGIMIILVSILEILDKKDKIICENMFDTCLMTKILSITHLVTPSVFRIFRNQIMIISNASFLLMDNLMEDLYRYGLTWEEANKKLEENHIDNYWKQKGLDESKIYSINISTDEPNKEREYSHDDGFDIREIYDPPAFINEEVKKTAFADQSDEMHTKSIHKRLAGFKTSPYQSGLMAQFWHMLRWFNKPVIEISLEEKIRKSLRTRGTAGEWAKRTILEEIWKTAEDEMSYQIWGKLSLVLIKYIGRGKAIKDKLFCYMMYRKREVLPLDEDGKVKITRLIQAAALEMRIPDAIVFGDFNETMVKNKDTSCSDIGTRIDHDLPKFLDPWETKWTILADFSDFDGHQTAMHMMGCKYIRQINNIMHCNDEEKIVLYNRYLKYKYRLHVERKVKTSWGIEVNMMGQLASGDIVTSDDNTMRAGAYLSMVIEKAVPQELLKAVKIKAAGDDTAIKGSLMVSSTAVMAAMQIVANQLGYKLKEAILFMPILQGNTPIKLGHSVEAVALQISKFGSVITVPAIIRPKERLYGKMFGCAEVNRSFTTKTGNIIIAKSISYMSMLWAMPEVVMACACIIIKVIERINRPEYVYEHAKIEADLPFTWGHNNVDKTKINSSQNIINSIGLNTNSVVEQIHIANRFEECEIMQKEFIKIAKTIAKFKYEEGEESKYIKKGWFENEIFFDDLADMLHGFVEVNTEVNCESKGTFNQNKKCEHVPLFNFTRENISMYCPKCILEIDNEGNEFRIVLGFAPTIINGEKETTEEEITVGSIKIEHQKVEEYRHIMIDQVLKDNLPKENIHLHGLKDNNLKIT